MKKIFLIALLCVPFLFVSCDFDNSGYPDALTFSKDGGTKTCTGTSSFHHIEITTKDGETKAYTGYSKMEEISYDWLTVTGKNEKELKITVAPNTTGKKRKLYLDLSIQNTRASIKITQK